MRRVLKNHHEVCHFWANQIQDSGKASNMFYERDIIYSYGYHFPIAKHIKDGLILFTSKDYSVSTSKHQSYTRQAIPYGTTVLTVPNLGRLSTSDISEHKENIKYYDSMLKHNMKKSFRARQNKKYYLNNVIRYIEELKTYLKIFRIKSKLPNRYKTAINIALNMDLDKIKETVKAEQEQQKKAELKRKAEQEKKFIELLPKWRNGEINSLPYSNRQYLRMTKVGFKGTVDRINSPIGKLYKNIEIQTSLNVKIDIETFKKYYAILKRGKSLIGEKISHYRVNKQDDKLLTIGCHKIELAEVELIANQLGV